MNSTFGVNDRPRELSREMAFDIRPLHRKRYLIVGTTYRTWVKIDGRRRPVEHKMLDANCMEVRWEGYGGRIIDIAWTACHYGGSRPWFTCPGCDRRCAVLYAPEDELLCRRCENLVYPSQNMTFGERAELKASKIRQRLGWAPSIYSPDGPKPIGMHQRTFTLLHIGYMASASQAMADTCRKMHLPPPDPEMLRGFGLDLYGRRLAKWKKPPRRRPQKPE